MRVLLFLLSGLTMGAAGPARLSPDQQALVRQALAHHGKALAAYKAGDLGSAVPELERAIVLVERVYGANSSRVLGLLSFLAAWEERRGRLEQAARSYARAAEVTTTLRGPRHRLAVDFRWAAETARSKARMKPERRKLLAEADEASRRARALYAAGRYDSALPLMRRALAGKRELLGEGHPEAMMALADLALAQRKLGDAKRAVEAYRQVLRASGRVLGEEHPHHLSYLEGLALAYQDLGEFAAAVGPLKRVLRGRAEVLGRTHPAYALSLNNLAALYLYMGRARLAVPLLREALAMRRAAVGTNSPEYAMCLNNLAAAYRELGEYRQALALLREVEAVYRAAGERHPSYATAVNNLAFLHRETGDFRSALPLYRKALALRKSSFGARHAQYGQALQNLGYLHYQMGDFRAALALYEEARPVMKAALGEKHHEYAMLLNNLAMLRQDMGEERQALALFEKALSASREALGPDHQTTLAVLNNLSHLHLERGDDKEALAGFEKVLAAQKKLLGEKHPRYGCTLNNLGVLYLQTGNLERARPYLEKSVACLRESLGEAHPHHVVGLTNLAELHLLLGQPDRARALSDRALARAFALKRDTAASQSERQELDMARALRTHLNVRLSLPDAAAYDHVLAWKGAVFQRQKERRLFVRLAKTPAVRETAEALQQTTREIAALSQSSGPRRERLEELTARQEKLQAELSRLSAEAGKAPRQAPVTGKSLAGALPADVALVDFAIYTRVSPADRGRRPMYQMHLLAFVVRKGKPVARVDLGPWAPAGSAVGAWRRQLLAGKTGWAEGEKVKKLIWSPLEKYLRGAKVVLVSPDGGLALVPFAALPSKKPGPYLIEEVALAVVPVPQALPELLKRPDKAERLKPSLLLVGDVDYERAEAATAAAPEDTRSAPSGARRDWTRLPATYAEAASVSRSFAGLFKGGELTDLSKGAATKKAVREALGKSRYAHFATHGFFSPQGPATAPDRKRAHGLFGREGVTGWHPMLLSGIVLAGANKEPKEGEEDGILTALEVSQMELPKLELVVLSACDTGLGKEAAGEGPLGIQRAFQVAGARSVVASLWQVDDRATQRLMSDFYRIGWDTKTMVSRAEALRRAQLAMLKEGRRRGLGKKAEKLPPGETRLPPLYWAAFVLSGDWR